MYRILACLVVALLVVMTGQSRQQPSPHVVPTDPLPPEKEKAQFVLPPGFEAQLVASEPDIQKPMNIAFDDQGRLWVTDTIEYPYPVKPGVKGRDTVKILEDFGPDGKARKITTFADGLNIPIGVQPLPGTKSREALVFSIPSIWHLQDTTGKGAADKRDVAYGTYEYRDTHGMTNNFLHSYDGWIYACHGFANRSTVKGKDGQEIVMQSGNTYRLKEDGSHLEQFTWGQVNPFGMTTDPLGYIYTSDCHSEPIYQLIRGGYYPSFGKPHDGMGFAPQMFTGYKGSTAIAGIAYYDADAFPAAYRGTAFVGDVVTNQIVQFRLSWQGASPKATQHVFLDCKDRWFRPVDVKLGPDGALYIADFYNRIIGHYEVPLDHPGRDRHRGRIWRIVYKGTEAKPTPVRGDWVKASIPDLVSDLNHPNSIVRQMAAHQLVKRGGKEVVDAVKAAIGNEDEARPLLHSQALWVLERLGALDEATLKREAKNPVELVRVHARRILGERAKWSDADRALVLQGLQDASPHVQRVSADALGQHPGAAHLRPLLDVRHRVPAADTHLLHTVRLALRNQLRPAENWKSLGEGKLSKEDARAIADVALGVPSPESARFVLKHLQADNYPLDRLTTFVQHVARHGDAPTQTALVQFAKTQQPTQAGHQAALFRAVERGSQERGTGLSAEARAWGTDLTRKLLASTNSGEVQVGIELTRLVRLEEAQKKLVEMVQTAATPAGQRGAAMEALFAIDAGKHAPTLGAVLIDARLPIETREHAARLLAQANQPAMRKLLVAALASAPARLQNSIASAMVANRQGAETLLQAITAGKASARLLQNRALLVRLEATRLPGLKARIAKLTAGLPPADARLTQLLGQRRAGFHAAKPDVSRGALVFEKSCANCHQVGGKGAKVGPQLDGIGLRGLDRLLEDTLDPNRNVDEAFRTTRLVLTSGKVLEGLLLREEGALLVLADNQGKEVRVPKKEIEERSISPLSPMPANIVEQVSEVDYYHLLAFLLAQKPTKP